MDAGAGFKDFCLYYRDFGAEFLAELWGTWRNVVWPAVLIAALVFALSYRHDPNARIAFLYTFEACGTYLAGWAFYHLIRTPWKLSRKPARATIPSRLALKELAESVLDFVYERTRTAPPPPTTPYMAFTIYGMNANPQTQNDYSHALAAYNKSEREILDVYGYKFSRRVVAAITEFRRRSGSTKEVEDVWGNPQSSEEIKQIGAALLIGVDEWTDNNKGITKTLDTK